LFEQSPDDPAISERWLNGQGLDMAAGELFEPAIGLLRIATELYPDSANTWDSVGYVYRQMGQLDRALQWYRKALAVDPEFPSAVKAVVELEAKRSSLAPWPLEQSRP
jgi:tetratricopeptide (TPR) repeat protein